MSKSSWGRPPLSFNVQKWLHDGLFGTWMILPVSADVRHFPCHRQYIGSTNRASSPAPARRRGSGAARGYWGLLGATMKGQVSSSEHLGGSIVCPPGAKAYGGGYFVAGLALLFGGGNVATTEASPLDAPAIFCGSVSLLTRNQGLRRQRLCCGFGL